LAVLCTPAPTIPGLIHELGEKGTKAAIVLTAGLAGTPSEKGGDLQQAMIDADCVGLIIPAIGLNASFAHTNALPGNLAFVSQSGAMATSVLDWSKSRNIGFSHFISLGNSADVDFGDSLDFLASDAGTKAILLYIESVKHARKFMSAARAAARNKPVIVIKAGRMAEGAQAAATHTGTLAGADNVYDAAIRRAGMLRVETMNELFDAVETLGRAPKIKGERLAILTNGGGAGVMATDALTAAGGQLATLSEKTVQRMSSFLPPNWSKANPVDIIGDAPVTRYVDGLKSLLEAPEVDSILFIHAPTAIVQSREIAVALAPIIQNSPRAVLACWLGGDGLKEARHLFSKANIPTYDTPEDAVTGFLQIVNYRRNQAQLIETPLSEQDSPNRNVNRAHNCVVQALNENRTVLTELESKDLLESYGVPIIETRRALTPGDAASEATDIGFPVALKILSPDITHKSDVGGVALHLGSESAVRKAADRMLARVGRSSPHARLDGFTVQKMADLGGTHELIAGATVDPTFGPVVMFGQGGTAVEVIGDRAVSLPPLNMALADELVSRTRVAKLLAGYRSRPAANRFAIDQALVSLSRLISDVPEIQEIDINPLLADENGVLALDARVKVSKATCAGPARLAIRPYPRELEETIDFAGQPLTVRPIKPEDERQHRQFFDQLDPDDIRFRFFTSLRDLSHADLARFTQIDYDREMALIATRTNESGEAETLGVARSVADPDNFVAEFSLVVRSDLKGRGLGSILLKKIIAYCRGRGTTMLVGQILPNNERMLALAHKCGFIRKPESGFDVIEVCLLLQEE
jgi:acetyltransferase